jgi:hypothetical protein
VVCRVDEETFDLIDGQQRTTTAYITLCAIRDALRELQNAMPEELPGQLFSARRIGRAGRGSAFGSISNTRTPATYWSAMRGAMLGPLRATARAPFAIS